MDFRKSMLDSMARGFGRLGETIERRPWLVIVLSALVAVLVGLGAGGIYLETEGVYLWIPTTSQTYKDFLTYNDEYQDGAKLNFLNLIVSAADGGSVLRKSVLEEAMDLHHNVTIDFTSKKGETFDDHCFKAVAAVNGVDSPCQANNFLQIFGYSVSGIPIADSAIVADVNAANAVSSIASALGGIAYDGSGQILSADTLLLGYALKNERGGDLLEWESDLVDYTVPNELLARYPSLTIQRLSSLAFDQEVVKLVANDMPLFMGAIYIIVIFLALTFGPLTRSHNRVLLAFVAIPQVLLSLLFATGCQGFFKAKISTLNFMLGFILAGVGVDDMIVIEEFYARAKAKGSSSVMKDTLAEGGLAVFLTSLTAVIAFLVGAFVDLPAVRSFCVCAGLAFAYNFVLNVTFFPAFLLLDEHRCCFGGTCACCVGRASVEEKKKEEKEEVIVAKKTSLAGSIFATYITPTLANPAVQIFVLVITFGAAIGVLIYGLGIEVGLSVTEVVPDDSYAVTFFDTLEEKFSSQIKIMALSVEGLDYSSSTQVANLQGLFTDIEGLPTVVGRVGNYQGHWLLHYQNYLSANSLDPYTDFGKQYITWLESSTCNNLPCNTYAMDVIGVVEGGELKSVSNARFFFEEVSPTETSEVWKVYNTLNGLRRAKGISGYYFIELFMYAENDSLMFMYLFRSLGVTLVAVAVIMAMFTDLTSTLYITLCVCCIDCHLLGIARLWDTRLNSVLFTCMIMSVGLSVDYCVHIAHAFVHAEEQIDPTKRLKEALTSLGPAVIKGGFTTLLGVALLSMASSSVFRMFFKMLFLTVLFGVFHGVISLPVMMCCHQKAINAFCGSSSSKLDTPRAEPMKAGGDDDNKL